MDYRNIIIKLIFSFFIVLIVIGCSKTEVKEQANQTTEEFVDTGVIVVESSPKSAQVYVDNELKGESPLTIYNFPVGQHDVLVKKEGYGDFKKTITLKVGTTEEVSARLSEMEVAKPSQDVILNKICGQETTEVYVNKCGSFYSTYPTGFISDAATEIFDENGKHIDFCIGYGVFASEKAKKESEQKCATYLKNCTQVVKACSSRTPVPTPKPTEENKPIEKKTDNSTSAASSNLNKVNISSRFITYYDFKNAMFTGTASASPDVFSSNYNIYLYFTAYSPATMKVLDKQIKDIKKEDCMNAQDTIANLYSGQTLCVKTTNGAYAAIGGKWEISPSELYWVLFS